MAKVGTVRFNIEADHARMSRQLAAANGKLSKFKSQTKLNMDGIRNSFVGAFGGFIVLNAVSSAIKSLAGFELQMDKVQAISGATNTQMEALTETALRLGRTSIFTASEIGKMEEELARLGFSTEKILASADAITKLALVTDRELGESAKTVAGTLNGFNLIAEDSGRVANIMAESFSSSALDLEKFTVATANSSANAAIFGASLEENTARLGQLVDRQIDASKAGTDLRRMYINLNAAGLTWNEGMGLIANSTDQMATAVELFDVRAAGAAIILANTQKETAAAAKKFGDTAFEIDEKARIMAENTATSFKLLTSAVDGFIQHIGSTSVLDAMAKFAAGFLNILSSGGESAFASFEKAGKIIGEDFVKATERSAQGLKTLEMSAKFYRNSVDELVAKQEALGFALDGNGERVGTKQPLAWRALQKQISQYTEILAPLDSGIKSITDKLEKEAAALLNSAKAAKEYASQMAKIAGVGSGLTAGGSKLDEQQNFAGSSGFFLDDQGTKGIDVAGGISKAFEESLKKQAELQQEYVDRTTQQVNDLNAIVRQTITEGIGVFVETLASGGGLEQAFAGLLGVIGEGLVGLGKTLVAYGVTIKAFKQAFENPFVAIAAGVAAIAIGAVFKKKASALAASASGGGGGGGRGSSGPSGSFTGGASSQQSIKFEPVIINGTDLALILSNNTNADNRATG